LLSSLVLSMNILFSRIPSSLLACVMQSHPGAFTSFPLLIIFLILCIC
jgi:hypothetical protein